MTRTKFTIDEGHTAALSLTRAVLVYQGGGSSFATVHNVGRGDTGPVILAGKPLTPAIAVRLARELARAPRAAVASYRRRCCTWTGTCSHGGCRLAAGMSRFGPSNSAATSAARSCRIRASCSA